jgi:type VI secretion system protein ImpM
MADLGFDGMADPRPGWFGKMPALGDFASRRMDPEFSGVWDEWLQHAIVSSRTSLGQEWMRAYVSAPVWRFAIFPGVLGQGDSWAGALMSSVDQVGRYFPLTAVLKAPFPRALLAEIQTPANWFDRLSTAMTAVLRPGGSLDQFEDSLQDCLFNVSLAATHAPGPDLYKALAMAHRNQTVEAVVHGPLGPAMAALAADEMCDRMHGTSLWWAELANGRTAVRCYLGLPRPDQYTGMLTAA